jgi:hypothetical protein
MSRPSLPDITLNGPGLAVLADALRRAGIPE